MMRRNLRSAKIVTAATRHDIKLELDVRCQELIARGLARVLPDAALLGEEGVSGGPDSPLRWVVDPIDGTVNFAHGIPHACVSIALQENTAEVPSKQKHARQTKRDDHAYTTLLGVIYDPFTDEMWTAVKGSPLFLNGKSVRVSSRTRLAEAILALGFAKSQFLAGEILPALPRLIHRVRKIRIMGSAALSLAYVACGRMDLYLEKGVRLWDIAAGGLMVECAGGEFLAKVVDSEHRYWMLASNGILGKKLLRIVQKP